MKPESPLAIDLFCGLGQTEFCLSADSTVKQLVACGTENPNHVRLRILHLSESAFSAVLWTMSKFYDSAFTARLARLRQVRVFAPHSDDDASILKLAASVVDLLNGWILAVKGPSRFLRRLPRAVIGAVATIAIWRHDREMRPANTAISTGASYIGLFMPSQAPSARLTSDRTVAFIWSFCGVASAAR